MFKCIVCGYTDDSRYLVQAHIADEHEDSDPNDWEWIEKGEEDD